MDREKRNRETLTVIFILYSCQTPLRVLFVFTRFKNLTDIVERKKNIGRRRNQLPTMKSAKTIFVLVFRFHSIPRARILTKRIKAKFTTDFQNFPLAIVYISNFVIKRLVGGGGEV